MLIPYPAAKPGTRPASILVAELDAHPASTSATEPSTHPASVPAAEPCCCPCWQWQASRLPSHHPCGWDMNGWGVDGSTSVACKTDSDCCPTPPHPQSPYRSPPDARGRKTFLKFWVIIKWVVTYTCWGLIDRKIQYAVISIIQKVPMKIILKHTTACFRALSGTSGTLFVGFRVQLKVG